MITTTAPVKRRAKRGFTLVEVLVATALSGILLTAILSTFVYLGRSGAGIMAYADLQVQSRRTFFQFGTDIRQASNASWTNVNTLVLTVDGVAVTYAYNSTNKQFTRAAGSTTTVIARNVSGFTFKAFNITGAELPLATSPTTVGASTKLIQVQFLLERGLTNSGKTTESALSAKFMLRNKDIT